MISAVDMPVPMKAWSKYFPCETGSSRDARIRVRIILTVLGWTGDAEAAADVTSRLIENAVLHGQLPTCDPQEVRLQLTVHDGQTPRLLIDVSDPNPCFADFAKASRGREGGGLWYVRKQGAELSCFLHHEAPGKTVRACMLAGRPVEL